MSKIGTAIIKAMEESNLSTEEVIEKGLSNEYKRKATNDSDRA